LGEDFWPVFESKDLTNNALDGAMYDRLCSLVYCALNNALNSFHDPKTLRKEWRELGAHSLAHVLVLSGTPEGASLPRAIDLDPWIAERLRPYNEEGLLHIVKQWLDGRVPQHATGEF
jgi:hypothetical protein